MFRHSAPHYKSITGEYDHFGNLLPDSWNQGVMRTDYKCTLPARSPSELNWQIRWSQERLYTSMAPRDLVNVIISQHLQFVFNYQFFSDRPRQQTGPGAEYVV